MRVASVHHIEGAPHVWAGRGGGGGMPVAAAGGVVAAEALSDDMAVWHRAARLSLGERRSANLRARMFLSSGLVVPVFCTVHVVENCTDYGKDVVSRVIKTLISIGMPGQFCHGGFPTTCCPHIFQSRLSEVSAVLLP